MKRSLLGNGREDNWNENRSAWWESNLRPPRHQLYALTTGTLSCLSTILDKSDEKLRPPLPPPTTLPPPPPFLISKHFALRAKFIIDFRGRDGDLISIFIQSKIVDYSVARILLVWDTLNKNLD